MAQKREIRGLIKSLLPASDKSAKYHGAVVDRAIERVLIEMYQELFVTNRHTLMRFTKGYGYATPLEVLLRASTGTYYTTLPAEIVTFRDNASGVRRISAPISTGFTFFPVDANQVDFLLNGTHANTVTDKIGYVVTHTEIEYYNMSGAILTSGVKLDLIIPFSAYAESDIVLIPETLPGRETTTFIDRVLAVLGVIQPRDQRDNNADVIRQTNNSQ